MLSKLKCIGFVVIFLFVYSPLVAQNYNQRSFQDLQQELTNLRNMVNDKNWWFYIGNNDIPVGSHRDDVINLIIQEKITWDNHQYNLDKRIRLIRAYTNGIKKDVRNTIIPKPQEQVRNHPDNPNIDPYTPEFEPSQATSCHSRGKGYVRIGTGRLQYRCRYYGSGQLHQETPYVNNKRQGTEMIYYENGNLSGKVDYWDDYITISRSFDKNGKTVCKKFDKGKYLGRCN